MHVCVSPVYTRNCEGKQKRREDEWTRREEEKKKMNNGCTKILRILHVGDELMFCVLHIIRLLVLISNVEYHSRTCT